MNGAPNPQPTSQPPSRDTSDRNLIVGLVVLALILCAFLLLAGIVGMTP
jgi:hypothetical protein